MSQLDWPMSEYLVNHRHRFVLCPIPKVASSSLKQWFISTLPASEFDAGAGERPHLALAEWSRHQSHDGIDDYRCVAFVREPARRLVSAYLQKVVQRWDVPESPGRSIVKRVQQRHGRPVDYECGITFREFVIAIINESPAELDPHWRPQHLFLPSEFPRNDQDFLGHVETFDADLLQISAALGLTDTKRYAALRLCYDDEQIAAADVAAIDLRHRDQFPAWQSFIDDEMAALIGHYYAVDYARLNYARPPAAALSVP